MERMTNRGLSLKGRVIELWSEVGEFFVELIVGSERVLVKTRRSQLLGGVRRGDLVSVYLAETETETVREVREIEVLQSTAQPEWSPLGDSMRWRRTMGRPSRMALLQKRQSILRAIRASLYEMDFLEVETPLLVKGTCPDTHIESISAGEGYLVTSTEYQIKRMMTGGFERVFTLTKNFRAGDKGRFHSSEFTMLEWARAYESMEQIEEDTVRIIQSAFQELYPGLSSLKVNSHEVHFLGQSWERLSVKEAFRIHLGMKNLSDFSLETLIKASQDAGVRVPAHFQEDKHLILSYLLDQLQSHLGTKTPTFLREWPAYMTSSAQLSKGNPDIAERSELYIGGIEISDGFPFLRDAELQKTLFSREIVRRNEEGKKSVTLDQKYVDALSEGIPPGAGMALGVDRLVMVLTGASTLAEVQAFNWDEL